MAQGLVEDDGGAVGEVECADAVVVRVDEVAADILPKDGLIIGLSGAVVYMSGGLGVFNWLSFIDPSGVNGINHMIWAIVASFVGAAVGFAIEFATYKPEAAK